MPTAKEFFDNNRAECDKLAADRDAGAKWGALEEKYGLDKNNGMSAYRVYHWVRGKAPAPAPKDAPEPKPDGTPLKCHRMYNLLLQCLKSNFMPTAKTRVHIFLSGPAGSGKTSAAENAAADLEIPFYPMSVGAQTPASQLLGYMDAQGRYVRSVFREAFENGGLFLLDEIDSGNPNVLTVLNAALANEYCSFPDGVIKRHDKFVCIAAGNTWGSGADKQYVGRNQLDAATLDRFTKMVWDYDEDLEKQISGNAAWVKRVQAIRKAVWSLKLRVMVTPRASLRGATLLAGGVPQSVVEDLEIFNATDKETKDKVLQHVR